MTIACIGRDAVLEAIGECDRAGREAFLSWHGYRGSTAYELEHDGARYPSKAIVGVAFGYEHGCEPLEPTEFSGGAEHSARALVHLGFTVRRGREQLSLDDVAIPQRLARRKLEGELRLYVCRPTNQRSVAACREHNFGVLLSPLSARKLKSGGFKLDDLSRHARPIEGLPYILDNGAWACSEAGKTWEPEPMLRLVERLGSDAGWLVLPDIVGGGERSLRFSLDFLAKHHRQLRKVPALALAVQDGMTPEFVRPVLEQHDEIRVIFVGGTAGPGTPEWKWKSLHEWAALGAEQDLRVHVGRVNSLRRAELCRELGVASIDGSSVSRYSVNAEKMARAHDGEESRAPGASLAIAQRRFEQALGALP